MEVLYADVSEINATELRLYFFPGSEKVMATETIVTGDQMQESSSSELFECDFCDVEEVKRLSHALLVALAAACVEKTSGTLSQRVAVLPGVKKEMLEYLNQQSQTYANSSSSLQRSNSLQVTYPTHIVKDMLETFIKSKRNMFSRVSGSSQSIVEEN